MKRRGRSSSEAAPESLKGELMRPGSSVRGLGRFLWADIAIGMFLSDD